MKYALLTRTMACCVAGSLLAGTAIAQQGTDPNAGASGSLGSSSAQPSSPPSTPSASSSSSSSSHSQKSERLSQLMGSTVKDQQGNTIGQINDFVVSPMSGRIQFAIISLTDQSGKLAAVPWQLVRPGADATSCTLRTSKDMLSSTQTFDASSWPDFSQPSTSQQIYSHFGVPGHQSIGNEGGTGTGDSGSSGTGSSSVPSTPGTSDSGATGSSSTGTSGTGSSSTSGTSGPGNQ